MIVFHGEDEGVEEWVHGWTRKVKIGSDHVDLYLSNCECHRSVTLYDFLSNCEDLESTAAQEEYLRKCGGDAGCIHMR